MTSQADRQNQANVLSCCISALKSWRDLANTYLEDEEKREQIEQLEEIVKGYCSIESEGAQALEVCEEVAEYLSSDNNDTSIDVDSLYKAKLKEKGSVNLNYKEHDVWKQIFMGSRDDEVEEVAQAATLTQDTEYEEMNDSIFYSNVFTPPVDPISKKVIQEPYKSNVCGHVYEQKFIIQYIKAMKNKAKCPYIGCGNKTLSMRELVADSDTQNKIQQYLQDNAEEDSDGE